MIHFGATTPLPPLTLAADAPPAPRHWNALPAPADTSIIAYEELPLRVARTITPAFAHRFVLSIAATRATSWPSPFKVR